MKKITQQDKDYKWFCDNISTLFDNYGYSFLAIKNKKVLGAYTSIVDGVNDMKLKKEKMGTYIIQKCAPDNSENMLSIASMNFVQVDVELPNGIFLNDVLVCDSEIGAQGIGMLVGMDIISKGDIAISNFNGRTIFSFRMPSCGDINLVKSI